MYYVNFRIKYDLNIFAHTTIMYIDKSATESSSVVYLWRNAEVEKTIHTQRGTLVEMVNHPQWGKTCYMDGDIQSSEIDEKLYHESLVHPVMCSVKTPKRIMIMGGGEGATAREILKWDSVEHIDMYEWDQDVIDLFKQHYPQWAKGAWDDSRLHLHTNDIFEVIQQPPVSESDRYDVIIIDLFEPSMENKPAWKTLFNNLSQWIRVDGSVVMYSGIRTHPTADQPYQLLAELLLEQMKEEHMYNRRILPYHFFLPCFLSEATCILWTSSHPFSIKPNIPSHITQSIWQSYLTFNW